MSKYTTRYYTPTDYNKLVKLWKDIDVWGADNPDTNEEILKCQKIGGQLFIMEDKSVMIGTGWLTFDGRFFHLHHFGILPSYRHKQLGRKLAKEIIKFTIEKGYPVAFEIKNDNIGAIKIYEELKGIKYPDYIPFVIKNE